jgi:hypothetical protein
MFPAWFVLEFGCPHHKAIAGFIFIFTNGFTVWHMSVVNSELGALFRGRGGLFGWDSV